MEQKMIHLNLFENAAYDNFIMYICFETFQKPTAVFSS